MKRAVFSAVVGRGSSVETSGRSILEGLSRGLKSVVAARNAGLVFLWLILSMPGVGQAGTIKMTQQGFNDFAGCASFIYDPPEAFDAISCSIDKVDTIDGVYTASLSTSGPAVGDSVSVCAELTDHVYETHAGAKGLKVAEVTVWGRTGSSDGIEFLHLDVTMDVPYCARAVSGLTGESLGGVAFASLQMDIWQEIGRAKSVPGYAFVGWTGLAVDLGCVSNPASPDLFVNLYRYFIVHGMTSQCRLVANYASADHTLTISSTEGGSVTTPGEGSYAYSDGTAVSIVATAEQGYRFTGWSGTAVTAGKVADSSASSTTVTMAGNYTLVANFSRIVHALNVSSTLGGSVTAPGEGTFSYAAGSSVSVVAVAAANYKFTGWTGTAVSAGKVANPGAASTTVTVDAAYTLVANFEATAPTIVRHTLTVSSGDGGSVVTPGEGAFAYDEGMWVWITAQADSGYRFAGWTGTAVTANQVANRDAASTTVFMDADYSVTANFEVAPVVPRHTLTVSATEGGRVSVPGVGSFTYDEGATVSIAAKPDAGCRFSGWTGAAVDAGKVTDPSSANTFVTLDGDYGLCANFVAAGQLAVLLVSPNGGEALIGGSIVPIQWQVKGAVDRVDIELSLDDGSTWTLLSQEDGAVGTYDWLVPTVQANRCLIRVKASQDAGVSDVSSSAFGIRGVLWYVDAAATGAGDGRSWQNAFVSLQDALAASSPGDGIYVAEGLYWPDLGAGRTLGDRTASFHLKNRVAVYGGFPTGGGTLRQRNPLEHRTILSGDLGKIGVPGDNCFHVVTSGSVGSETILDGCMITGGCADGVEPYNRGGGMHNEGNPVVRNCTFLANAAVADGGGVYNSQGSPTFINCVFNANTAGDGGGGMCNVQSTVALVNCTLAANEAYWRGGGIFHSRGSLSMTNSILWGNVRACVSGRNEQAQLSCDSALAICCSCVQGWTGSLTGHNSFGSDPQFVDADGPDNTAGTLDDDLRLRDGSPCIDAGDNGAVPAATASDLQGRPRIAGGLVDVGAYEFIVIPDE